MVWDMLHCAWVIKSFKYNVIVADEDEGILGMDFPSQADFHIDVVKIQVSIHGEVHDCFHFKNKPLSSRCMMQQSTRTLVDVNEDRVVLLRVFNVSDEVYHLAAETVVSLAKLVIDVTSLELYEENHESVVGH